MTTAAKVLLYQHGGSKGCEVQWYIRTASETCSGGELAASISSAVSISVAYCDWLHELRLVPVVKKDCECLDITFKAAV